jgi:nitrogen fixation NifU-like protein
MTPTPAEVSGYQQLLLEHYRRPHNRGQLVAPTHQSVQNNRLCGDQVVVQCRVVDGVIAEVAFDGSVCSVSQASASLMTVAVRRLAVGSAVSLAEAFSARLNGGATAVSALPLGQLEGLLEVARFPARITCALLPWKALVAALEQTPS